MPIKQNTSHISDSQQVLLNKSRDDEFNILAVENLTYNDVSGTLERETKIQGNGSQVLSYTDGNLTGIAKTIGSKTYEKTLSYTDGNLTGITSWS